MTKKTKINSSRRNFLAGSATFAGAAAAASVMPISIAKPTIQRLALKVCHLGQTGKKEVH